MQENENSQQTEEKENLNQPAQKSFWINLLISVFDFVKTVATIIILAIITRVFIVQPYIVEGLSMEQSFQNNDYLITEKISYELRAPKRGEVIIFHPPDNPSVNYIKRIVGLPGDTVEIKNGSVYINNSKLSEPYLKSNEETLSSQKNTYSMTLKDDEYFVFGDNRNHSRDSREIGAVPKSNIVSRVWFRLLPVNKFKAFAAVNYGI